MLIETISASFLSFAREDSKINMDHTSFDLSDPVDFGEFMNFPSEIEGEGAKG